MIHTLRKIDDTLGSILHDGTKIMFFLFAACAFIVCWLYQRLALPHPYSLDYGEAPLIDHAMRLTMGENIYRADLSQPPYTITNYPPLYMALLAVSVKLFGPAEAFLAGRIISALCCWIAALCIYLILFKQINDRLAAAAGATVFFAFPFVVFWSPLLRIDMLALALSLGGLTTLIWKPGSRLHFIVAGLLLVAAIYTRQSYALAAPFAAFVWLAARDWKQAFRFAALVGGVAFILFIVFHSLTDGGFFYNIVTANANEFRTRQLMDNAKRFVEVAFMPLLFGGLSLFLIPRWNPLWTLAAPYLIGSLISAATIGKVGSNMNYLLEFCAALGLAAGIVVAASRAHLKFQAAQAVVLALLAVGIGRSMHFMLIDYGQDLRDRRAAVTELHQLKAFVAETPGEILADEYMGMLTLLGRPLSIQPFEVTQMSHDGQWDQTPLLESIRNREFAAIILYDRPWSIDDRWTPEMMTAITESYVLVDVIADNRVYRAFQPAPATSIESCPSSKWRLPSDASLGVQWGDDVLSLFGRSSEGNIPVYAVADGSLTRPDDWTDGVAILHQDPIDSSKTIWAIYGGMANASGETLVLEEFSTGAKDIPIKAGQLLGYQGTWSGTSQWPMWKHASFILLDAYGSVTFPRDSASVTFLNPAAYLGLSVDRNNKNLQPMKCEQP